MYSVLSVTYIFDVKDVLQIAYDNDD